MLYDLEGDLLESDSQYIVHQLNCVTTTASGLAAQIFDKFPYANAYAGRILPSALGTIDIRGDGVDQRFVIGIFGQYYPGKSKYPNDSEKDRLISFKSGLIAIHKLNPVSIAFPFGIGCGLAGGAWNKYRRLIEEFSAVCEDTKVYVVRK